MFRKVRPIFLFVYVFAIFMLCYSNYGYAQKESLKRLVSEENIAELDLYSWFEESFVVSPDSKHVAYGARVGGKCFVVVDGREGKKYDAIVSIGGGRIIFDSPDSLHYLAIKKDNEIYLVQENIN